MNLCTIVTITAEIYRFRAMFFPLIVWVYFHSRLHSEPRKRLYMVVSALQLFKVVQGHRNWYQTKSHMWLPIVFHCNYMAILRRFLYCRYTDFLAENLRFLAVLTHPSQRVPLGPMTRKLFWKKTRMIESVGYPSVKKPHDLCPRP